MKSIFKTVLMAALLAGAPYFAQALDIKNGDKIAFYTGSGLENYAWGPSGHLKLLADELNKAEIKGAVAIDIGARKSAQMLEKVDAEIIAKKPAYVFIIPGTIDYNVFAQKAVDPSFAPNLAGVVEKLKAANIKPILVTLYAVNSNPSEARNAHTAEHNEAIRTVAKEHGATLFDFVKVIDTAKPPLPLDGSLAAKAWVSQLFAAEVLRLLGAGEAEIAASREAWLNIPGVKFPPSVSVNTYAKLKAAAQASGKDVDVYITEVLHDSVK